MSAERKDDGGPAFPVPSYVNANGETFESKPSGMTLRDWFAGQALVGMLAAGDASWSDKDSAADEAYNFANAMLRARK